MRRPQLIETEDFIQRFDRLGWRNKQWTTQDGKLYGGSPLCWCHIYKLPGNILYTGRVKVGIPGRLLCCSMSLPT